MAPVRAFEFYSGIGGMHYALAAACPGAEVLRAFDINPAANDCYEANFGLRPWQGNIEAIPKRVLDDPSIDIWLLAPPCQPYTRRGLKKGAEDGRAGSFLNLLRRLPTLQSPPAYLLVENVVGFETSSTAEDLRAFLGRQGYVVQEFLLSPTQLGVPYSRPRYFCLARKLGMDGSGAFPLAAVPGQPLAQPPAHLLRAAAAGDGAERDTLQENRAALARPSDRRGPAVGSASPGGGGGDGVGVGGRCSGDGTATCDSSGPRGGPRKTVGDFLVADPAAEGVPAAAFCGIVNAAEARRNGGLAAATISSTAGAVSTQPAAPAPAPVDAYAVQAAVAAAAAPASSSFDPADGTAIGTPPPGVPPPPSPPAAAASLAAVRSAHLDDPWTLYRFPDAELVARGIVLDVASPVSTVVNCFTKTYGRYSKGSGSVLATAGLEQLAGLAAAFPQYHAAAGGGGADPKILETSLEAGLAQELEPGAPAGQHVQLAAATEAAAALGLKPGEPLVPTPAPLLDAMRALRLRYFTPAEVAAMHGFLPEFRFPPHLTLKQRYALLGNSLSVDIVAALLRYLLQDGAGDGARDATGDGARDATGS